MKRYTLMMAAVGIVLLTFAACGSAAPEKTDDNVLFAANGPALTVVEKQPDQYVTDPGSENTLPEQSPDLLTMNSEEEAGYALFYPLLSETQFRCLMAQDGVNFIPNRLVQCEEGGIAYYNSTSGDLVYCTSDFSSVKAILCDERIGFIKEARWLDADRLLFLQGDDSQQAVYLFRPQEDIVELLYQSPEGRQILGIEIDEEGQPVCILSALPSAEETTPTPDNSSPTDANTAATEPEETGEDGAYSAAKDFSGGWEDWDDLEDEKTELGDSNAAEEPTAPTEKVELPVPQSEPAA